ncbi:MAG: glycosyltransferase family 2 protein [Ruminococcaceae bacterium]|nr:glycosyltransferase family 2 protein [Oscillospiraceae bacterium]
MNNQKISIIIPIYKTEKFLRKCIESVLNQIYSDLEVILVDDGSPDRCGEICDEYAAKDSRIKVIHKDNGGLFSAKNEGMKHATGEWISFVDSDDYIDPTMYEYLISLTNSDIDFVQCGIIFEESDRQWTGYAPKEVIFWDGGCGKIQKKEMKFWANSTCNKLYRRSMLDGLFFSPEYTLGEDLFFNIYVLNKFRGAVLGTKALYHYVQQEKNMCHSAVPKKQLMNYFNISNIAMSLFSENKKLYDFYYHESFTACATICSIIVRNDQNEPDVIDKMRSYARENFRCVLFSGVKISMKLKMFLIAYCWWLYRPLLLWLKRKDLKNNR